jgi:hypothetical protein
MKRKEWPDRLITPGGKRAAARRGNVNRENGRASSAGSRS